MTDSGGRAVVVAVAMATAVVLLVGLAVTMRNTAVRTARKQTTSERSVGVTVLDDDNDEYGDDGDGDDVSLPGGDTWEPQDDDGLGGRVTKERADSNQNRARVRVIGNPGGGDCLFHCFVQAARATGASFGVDELRSAVADSLTEEILAELRSVYDGAVDGRDAELIRDYDFMKGVKTLDELRSVVRTSRYWGDELALPALEKATGLRAVVVLGEGRRARVAARFEDDAETVPKRFMFVRLKHAHYELLEVGGRLVFENESPMTRGGDEA